MCTVAFYQDVVRQTPPSSERRDEDWCVFFLFIRQSSRTATGTQRSTMSFELLESEDGDMVKTFDIFAEVLPAEVYFWHLFPNYDTPAGKRVAVERLLEEKQSHHAKFLKVIDTTTGEMAGAALWLIFENEKVPLADDYFDIQGDFWDTQEKKEQAQYAVREFSQFRKNAIDKANGNILCKFSSSLRCMTLSSLFGRRSSWMCIMLGRRPWCAHVLTIDNPQCWISSLSPRSISGKASVACW